MTARTIEIAVNGQSHRVTVERVDVASDRYRVSWDGVTRVVDARPLDETTLSLVMVDGSSASHAVRCVPTTRQGELEVHIAGVVVRTLVDTSHGRFSGAGDHGRAADGEHAVTAPMPGKVVRVLVQPGELVEARQAVIVIEAMKMENELRALRAGRVKEISVEVGMLVEAGRVLAVIA